jgi:hypothetical protein
MVTHPFQSQIDAYIDANLPHFMTILGELCAIPSVAAQGHGIAPCAQRVAELFGEVRVDGPDYAARRQSSGLCPQR